jgi:hypothetical protein
MTRKDYIIIGLLIVIVAGALIFGIANASLKSQLITSQQNELAWRDACDQARYDFDLQLAGKQRKINSLTDENEREQAFIVRGRMIDEYISLVKRMEAEIKKLQDNAVMEKNGINGMEEK